MRLAATVRASSRGPLLQVLKTSVSAIAAWLISSLLLGQVVPIFAAIAALLVVAPSVNQSLAKGIERSFGVILGVVIAYLAGLVFGSSSPVVLGTIVVSLLAAWALKLTQDRPCRFRSARCSCSPSARRRRSTPRIASSRR